MEKKSSASANISHEKIDMKDEKEVGLAVNAQNQSIQSIQNNMSIDVRL